MKLEQSFEVEAPVERVWAMLIDVERVAPCLPGAEITEAHEDGSYEGSFKVKLGPTTAAYTGKLSMESLDEQARRATMSASGRDKRGQGSANATIVSTLRSEGATTHVGVETDFTITGRLARFGRGGMIEDISNRLLREFADCLQRNIESEGAAAADAGGGPAGAGEAAGGAAVPDRPPTAAPGPAPAATGEGDGTPPVPAAAPSGGSSSAPRARAPSQPAKPVRGLSLFLSVLAERIKRLFSRIKRLFSRRR